MLLASGESAFASSPPPPFYAEAGGRGEGKGLLTESRGPDGAYVLLGDVALLLGVVLLLLPVLLFQQLGQCLQGLGAAQRGPLGVAGVVLNEVDALALHLDLEEERGRRQGLAQRTHAGSCSCPHKGQSKEAPAQDTELQVCSTYPQPIPSPVRA